MLNIKNSNGRFVPRTKSPGFERSMVIKIVGFIIFAIGGIITDDTVNY